MSLDGYGSIEDGVDVGMSGAATSAAEAGGGSGADARELAAESGRVRSDLGLAQLPPGVVDQNVQDYRNEFIAAGGGQRVNPGFFDDRNTVSPAELAAAKAYDRSAFSKNRRGGIMDFITGGGFLGNIVRGIGQKFGLGKRYNEPTYDMRQFSNINPTYYNDFDNKLMSSTEATPPTLDLSKLETGDLNNLASLIEASKQPQSNFDADTFDDKIGSSNKYMVPFDGARTIVPNPNFTGELGYEQPNIEFGGTVLEDDFPSEGIMSQVDDVPTDLEIFKKRFP
jgi:hypothetical protein